MSKILSFSATEESDLSLYFTSFLADAALGMTLFTVPLVAINLRAGSLILGALGFTFMSAFIAFAFLGGSLSDRVGRKNILVFTPLFYVIVFVLFSLSTKLYQIFILMGMLGLCESLFWPSMMASFGEREGVTLLYKRLAVLNASWAMGFATGQLIGGVLFEVGSRLPFLVASGFAIAFSSIIVSELKPKVVIHKKDKKRQTYNPKVASKVSTENVCSKKNRIVEPRKKDYSGEYYLSKHDINSDYLYVTWIVYFVINFSWGSIRFLFPQLSTNLGISAQTLGILMFSLSFFQCITFLVSGSSSFFPHHGPLLLVVTQTLAFLALLIISASTSPLLFFLSFSFMGMASAMAFFISLYASLHMKKKGRGAGIHFTVGSMGFLCGSTAGGGIAKYLGLTAPYLASALLIVGSLLFTVRYFYSAKAKC